MIYYDILVIIIYTKGVRNMRSVISNFFAEFIQKTKQLEILSKILNENLDVKLISSLTGKLNKLTYEDKKMIATTFNKLSLVADPQVEADRKEQEDLIRLFDIYAGLLLSCNQFQRSRLHDLTKGLNGKQQLAAIVKDGPLLLSAGPGSGKTRVLTYKIGVLLDVYDVSPGNVLAVTFTNKAANEMKERVKKIVGDKARQLNMGTFHSICTRFLRQNIEVLNSSYNKNFSIADDGDQTSILKDVLESLGMDKKLVRDVKAFISTCKNELKTVKAIMQDPLVPNNLIKAYSKYQNHLSANNLLDYDDLILLTVYILNKYEEVREHYQMIYKYVHIDEYQDTNYAQYKLAQLLTSGHRNITVVGDSDQSIYKFRGADITNILRFTKDYPDALSITLGTNYRSTKTIVEASSHLISHNKERLAKTIVPFEDSDQGDLIECHSFFDDKQESSFIASKVKQLMEEKDLKLQDFMVLYRTNSLSRALEESFIRTGIPYRIVSGTEFYDREEIQDLVSYLKLSVNLQDGLAFQRIYNKPARKLSTTVFNVIVEYASQSNISYFQASLKINQINNAHYNNQPIPDNLKPYILQKPQFQALNQFLNLVKDFYDKAQKSNAYEMLEYIIETINYKNYIRSQYKKDLTKQIEKLSNIDELLRSAADYTKNYDVDKDTPLEFISFVSLIQDSKLSQMEFDEMETLNKCTLNLKKEDETVAFFGRNDVQKSGMYEFKLSLAIVKDLVGKMSDMIKEYNGGVKQSINSISDVVIKLNEQTFILEYEKKFYFEFSFAQFTTVIEYLQNIVEQECVSFMSMHSAKGLESKVVFILGAEQGITPHFMNITTNLEEERRLFYVAMTRAEEMLFITNCVVRFVAGQNQKSNRSQFVRELPEHLLYEVKH
jgi:DNA helicase-2/ATP-dependent DNA helicase PcrA